MIVFYTDLEVTGAKLGVDGGILRAIDRNVLMG